MFQRKKSAFTPLLVILFIISATAGVSFAEKPTVLAPCTQCHQPEKDLIRGTMVSVTEKFKTINVQVGQKLVWIISYGDDLKVTGADKLSAIPKEKEIAVRFTGDEKTPHAVSLTVKPPAKIPAEKLVNTEDVQKLIVNAPEKGNYVLIDSRPKPRYSEGHILHAVNMPADKFEELKDKILSKEKDRLIVFYCAGVF